jgi:FixJ family two-component response regulator
MDVHQEVAERPRGCGQQAAERLLKLRLRPAGAPLPLVLVVDDFTPMLQSLERRLGHLVQVVGVETVREGMAHLIGGQSWAASIFDLSLPDGSGWSLVQAARTYRPHMLTIVYTAAYDPRVFHRAIDAGARYLDKEAEVARLIDLIHDALPAGAARRAAVINLVAAEARALDLSYAEALLLASELCGEPRGRMLDDHNISLQTRKWHIKHVLAKARAESANGAPDWEELLRRLHWKLTNPLA